MSIQAINLYNEYTFEIAATSPRGQYVKAQSEESTY